MQPVAIIQKLRQLARHDLVARIGKRDGDHLLDATGTAVEHGDAITEIDRLFDIVRDKDEAGSGPVA